MQAMNTDPRSAALSSLSGAIRAAEPRDLADVAWLLRGNGIDTPSIEAEPQRSRHGGHLLVFDLAGAIRGVACVAISLDRRRGKLQALVLDPHLARVHARAIQERLTGVAIALCEAYECTEIDVAVVPSTHVGDQAHAAYAG